MVAEQAFIRACALDIETLKPGNVGLTSPGHGMTAEQFMSSAAVAAPAVCRRGAPVGERILAAVEATRAAVGCNTNLGILLLCAPIAAALESCGAESTAKESAGGRPPAAVLRHALLAVLDSLTVADAQAAFRAIVLANPGGLGEAVDQDVHHAPTLDLRAAMSLASDRDQVARQYADGYADVFDIGLGEWQAASPSAADGHEGAAMQRLFQDRAAMQRVFLGFLSRFPDSHIVRKQNLQVAQSVTRQAQHWRNRLSSDAGAAQAGLARWDDELKAAGLNPGSSADLSVATAFVASLIRLPSAGVAMARR